MRAHLTVLLLGMGLLAGGLCHTGPAGAQATAGDGQAVLAITLRKAQAMLVKLSEENARLDDARRELEARLRVAEASASELAQLEPALAQARDAATALRAKHSALVERIDRDAQRLRRLREERQALAADLTAHQQDNALLVQIIKERDEWIASCSASNTELVGLNRELLERDAGKTWWSAVKLAEPLTQIGRVEEETLQQRYRFRLDDLTVTPWTDDEAPGAGARGTP